MTKVPLALAAALTIAALGCSLQQPSTTSTTAITRETTTSTEAAAPAVPAHALPFKGHLASGHADELPPAVAMSLAKDSVVAFAYREELSHDEYHIPLFVTALDPVTYIGAPLGDYRVTAFASLTITEGDRILGDYTAKAYVSKSYNLYSEPTHKELEDAARAQVRDKIDQKLYQDADKLAAMAANPETAPPIAVNR